MADIADMANDVVQQHLEEALAARVAAPVRESRMDCIDCDDPIPESRRVAARGCVRCGACQTVHEDRRAQYAR
ncbi:conjugal transfer protein TraR [Pseudomonas guariconensis]|uniref:Conjugal transfer protein TraR n=2 Tax=Pseudomonas guariconensis TaxID=1288410 RepID=A0AAX0VV06_9PSED|nr:TraR/DksA C4-type zinc finger protein [Pseudomonas guariconensis]PLV18412.1 conjugal transfer protein TraR [Pseudomonas guariconensis]PLV23243.1 conjugal transfer protein TraR [Pseudomonas guariconensis]PLV28266.1 conjugal transfer protein TraR [Pseudomonas guariconensis]